MSTSPHPFLSANVAKRGPLRRLVSVTSRADVVGYEIASPRWTAPPLNMVCVSDIHAMRPSTSLASIKDHVTRVNGFGADIILLLGDYRSAGFTPGVPEDVGALARVLAQLEAPLGVHAILGNHDWTDDPVARAEDFVTSEISQALTEVGLRPLINTSRRIAHNGHDFWLVGFDSQCAFRTSGGRRGRHDPEQAFEDVPDESLAILLAHEPDYFVFGDHRPVLQLSGHTHGGQANFFGWRPFTPSEYASRYVYGHIVENDQHLVVSGGLGFTHVPMRIMQPPEITLVRLTQSDD